MNSAMNPAACPRVVTLGVAGGPRIWDSPDTWESADNSELHDARRAGIATAVVVADRVYLVDAGHSVFTQMARAGLHMSNVRGVFLTHLHSDHTIDLNNLLVFGLFEIPQVPREPIAIMGPGDRSMLPPISPRATVAPVPVAPYRPTPGTAAMVDALIAAHATDLNDRILDALRPSPTDVFRATDISIPDAAGYHPNDNPSPDMEPFEIYRDDVVTVTATLVVHPPIAPAFAFRFDTAHGSVTVSGDTRPSENLVRLARDTDLLMHEAIDFDWVQRLYGDRTDDTAKASIDHHHKSHTSAVQAGELATRAGARALLLHHLVPGNTPHSVWRKASKTFAGPLHIARDLDSIPFGHVYPDVESGANHSGSISADEQPSRTGAAGRTPIQETNS